MAFPFERFIAFRYLRSKRREVFISIISIISVLGVALSVMVLNIVLSVMTGFEAELQEKLLNANAHVVVRHQAGNIHGWPELVSKVRSVKGVVEAEPYTYNQALLSANTGAHGLLIRGVADAPESRAKLEENISDPTVLDKLFSPPPILVRRPDGEDDEVKLPGLLVGRSLANRYALRPGTTVTILSPELRSSPRGLIPKVRRFVVVGSYSSGLQEYEGGLAYAALPEAQQFFGLGDSVTGIEVKTEDMFKAQAYAGSISHALGGLGSSYYTSVWTEQNRPLWEAIKLEKRVYFIVLLLLIVVASFSIVSTLVMVVMEKGKDIAILKTLGASDRSILKIFLYQGLTIGIVGTFLGTVLGLAGGLGLREYGFEIDESVFSLSTVPVHFIPSNFVMVAIAGVLITAGAGVYPALRAARLNPAEALRYE